jgi:hypothetical protein
MLATQLTRLVILSVLETPVFIMASKPYMPIYVFKQERQRRRKTAKILTK